MENKQIYKFTSIFLILSLLVSSIWYSITNWYNTSDYINNTDQKINNTIAYPWYWNIINYSYNETSLKQEYDKIKNINALYKISCNFNKFNIKNLSNIWIENQIGWNTYLYNYDIKNCNLNISNIDINYDNKSISIDKATILVKEFIKNIDNEGIYKNYWEPIIINKGSYPIAYWIAKSENNLIEDDFIWDIVIDETDNTNIEKEYQNITFLFPYKIGKMDVYSNYWDQYWITIQISWNKVSYISAPLLNFKLVRKTSEKNTQEDIINLIKNWWNSPYYNNTNYDIKFNNIKPVIVQFNNYNNNKNDNYLSIWLNLESDTIQPYTDRKYRNIISLYKIWNNY